MSAPEQPPPATIEAADSVEKVNTNNYKGLFVFFLLVGSAIVGTYLVVQWINEATLGIKVEGLGTTLGVLVFSIAATIIALQAIERHFTKKVLGIQQVYVDAIYTPPMAVAYDASGSKETDLDVEDLVTLKWFGLYIDKCTYIDVSDDYIKKVLLGGQKALKPEMENELKKIIDGAKPGTVPPDGKQYYAYHMLYNRPRYYKNVLEEVKGCIDPIEIFPAPLVKCIQRHPGNVPANGFRYDHPDTDHLVMVHQVTILGDLPVYYAAFSSFNRDQVVQPTKLSQELATNIVVKSLTFLYSEKAAELDPINQSRIRAEARTLAVRNANVATAVKDLPAPPADTAARDAFNRYKARWGPKGSEIPVYWFITIAITVLYALKLFGVY